MLGQEPKGVKCPAIDGLIEEADDLAGEVADKQVLDAAIVGSPKRSNITRSPATGS
jgi:ferritin-like metal-binding protein YciE